MGTQATATRIYNLNINTLACELRSRRFTDILRISLKSENPMPSGCWFRYHHGMTFRSYGERITVSLNAMSPTSTLVEVHSEAAMPTQLIDFGINNSNINAIFAHLDNYVLFPIMAQMGQPIPGQPVPPQPMQAQHAPAAPAPQQPMPAAQPAPQSAPAKICNNCGAQLEPSYRFCNCCGASVI